MGLIWRRCLIALSICIGLIIGVAVMRDCAAYDERVGRWAVPELRDAR